ncbi:tryptophan halogenase [Caballeronia calidae]|uniref:Tryptophan halogenase n=1 Tax=Caballeronia calidae TaxID=1777139 RepID=A0A158EFY9_9BURK|nr:FAD-dependent oxidoreductase [Caballeronia calidae]SAL05785.1 tryptophan halogenase [Caballeronia calidae]
MNETGATQLKFTSRDRMDVVVIGGGPAGCATAIALARRGLRVAMFEQSSYDRVRVGETLPPESRVHLAALDALRDVENDAHLPSSGIASVWGNEGLHQNDFIFNPYGHGWHLDRCRFDAMLARRAADVGVQVFLASTARWCEADSNGFEVEAKRTRAMSMRLRSRFVVDATGRGASPLPGQQRRIVYDKLVGLVGFVAQTYEEGDSRTLLEAVRDGWWYTAPLPAKRRVVVYMTDGDQLKHSRRDLDRFFLARLSEAPHTGKRVGMPSDVQSLHVLPASTYRHVSIHGERWVKVGDSACSYDPLSSSGVSKGLQSGLDAAAAVEASLDGDPFALANYTARVEQRFAQYLGSRALYYGREMRWPESAFWQRRH